MLMRVLLLTFCAYVASSQPFHGYRWSAYPTYPYGAYNNYYYDFMLNNHFGDVDEVEPIPLYTSASPPTDSVMSVHRKNAGSEEDLEGDAVSNHMLSMQTIKKVAHLSSPKTKIHVSGVARPQIQRPLISNVHIRKPGPCRPKIKPAYPVLNTRPSIHAYPAISTLPSVHAIPVLPGRPGIPGQVLVKTTTQPIFTITTGKSFVQVGSMKPPLSVEDCDCTYAYKPNWKSPPKDGFWQNNKLFVPSPVWKVPKPNNNGPDFLLKKFLDYVLLITIEPATPNGQFILNNKVIHYVNEVPTPRDGLFRVPYSKFVPAKILTGELNRNPAYVVMPTENTYEIFIAIVPDHKLPDLVVHNNKIKPVKSEPKYGAYLSKKRPNSPVFGKVEKPPNGGYWVFIPIDGGEPVKVYPTNPTDPDVVFLLVGGNVIPVKPTAPLVDGILHPNGTVEPIKITVVIIHKIPGYLLHLDKTDEILFVKPDREGTPGGFYIIYQGKKIYVVPVTITVEMNGYFIKLIDTFELIDAPIVKGSVAGKKGFWVLKDNVLEFAKESAESIANGYWILFEKRRYYVVVMPQIKANGVWKGTGSRNNKKFYPGMFVNVKLGKHPVRLFIHQGKLNVYGDGPNAKPTTDIIVVEGIESPTKIWLEDLTEDGYFKDTPRDINFVPSEITFGVYENQEGYYITFEKKTQFVTRTQRTNPNGVTIFVNGQIETVLLEANDAAIDFPKLKINEKTVYLINHDGSDVLVEPSDENDDNSFPIVTTDGKVFVKPMTYNGYIVSVNGKPKAKPAKIQTADINNIRGFVVNDVKKNYYVREATDADKQSFDIIYRGRRIRVALLEPKHFTAIKTFPVLIEGKWTRGKVVPALTLGAIKVNFNGKDFYVTQQ